MARIWSTCSCRKAAISGPERSSTTISMPGL
jgi:hypothetical protein